MRLKQETPEEELLVKTQLAKDQVDTRVGEIIYCDDVPVNPTSIGDCNYFFVFRDTKSRKIFSFPTSHNDEQTYLKCLYEVLAFFARIYRDNPDLGHRPTTIIRTDRFKTFSSAACKSFYLDQHCTLLRK